MDGFPRPLVAAPEPDPPPDAEAAKIAALLLQVTAQIRDGVVEPELLEAARYETYHQASLHLEDRWRLARVADLEEWVAELALRRNDLETAWHAWRSAFWVRHLLSEKGERPELWEHSKRVMAQLREATGRTG